MIFSCFWVLRKYIYRSIIKSQIKVPFFYHTTVDYEHFKNSWDSIRCFRQEQMRLVFNKCVLIKDNECIPKGKFSKPSIIRRSIFRKNIPVGRPYWRNFGGGCSTENQVLRLLFQFFCSKNFRFKFQRHEISRREFVIHWRSSFSIQTCSHFFHQRNFELKNSADLRLLRRRFKLFDLSSNKHSKIHTVFTESCWNWS